MKFRFDDQPHQAAAISAVTDLFENAFRYPLGTLVGQAPGSAGHGGFSLDLDVVADNLGIVTERERVNKQTELALLDTQDLRGQVRRFCNFSVEMETGTGKTYVYIATALRLAELYGLRKFVMLVHSVAIRAGVEKTFVQAEQHFRTKYPGVAFTWGVLGESRALEDFTEPSDTVRFLIASVQAVDKPATNAIYQEAEQPQLWNESLSGIGAIASANPVVIIDEPQNMATDLRRRTIATLNPLFALRYSATHREPFNLVHRLGPKAASEANLVKRVAVKGVVAGAADVPYVNVKKVRSVRRRLMADAVINRATRNGIERADVVVQPGTDLQAESEGLPVYRGIVVDRIERKPDRVVFSDGSEIEVGQEIGVERKSVWRDQIRHVIRQHFLRERALDAGERKVKVLSLFFVERVANYVGPDATLPAIFDELYREEWARAGRPPAACPSPADLRVHYFPSTKTGILKDTKGTASDAEFEARAYAEIIADKELILQPTNPRAFIFSHSALREGWDNPNVFQIGFLRHAQSIVERRQQIGRGLRLPVDSSGARVFDPERCRLTLVVDESFASFRQGLNDEYLTATAGRDAVEGDAPVPENVDDELVIRRRPHMYGSPEFEELWNRIRYRAHYRVTLDPAVLPAAVADSERLEAIAYLPRRANVVQSGEIEYDDAGLVITSDKVVVESQGEAVTPSGLQLPNVLRLVEDQLVETKFPLQLTRRTVAAILEALPLRIRRRALDDPYRWARVVADAIRATTIEELVNHIVYEPMEATTWWDAEVVFLEFERVAPAPEGSNNRGVVRSPEAGSNLYDGLVYDSQVERDFAAFLEADKDRVKLFTKLPRRFRVRTPVGEYSPDWAIVVEDGGTRRLYLVRETKAGLTLDDLEWDEAMRIRFAKCHFEAAPAGPIDFTLTTPAQGLALDSSN